MEIFGIPLAGVLSQLLIGLVNGSFYAMLSLGLAVIFGLLNVVNFAHGAMFMLGAMIAWMGGQYLGLSYWVMLFLSPLVVFLIGLVIEKLFLKHLYKLDHLYGLLLTFGITLVVEGLLRTQYGVSGLSYSPPELLRGSTDLGFMVLPNYRAWVVFASLAVCLGTWLIIEKTKLGALLRAGTENPKLVEAFGINVPRMVTLTYGLGVALAAVAGVLAAPVLQVSPLMGSNLIIVVFAVVVIGGMGSILGSILTGLALGVIEGMTKVFYPEASTTVVFVIMVLVLMFQPETPTILELRQDNRLSCYRLIWFIGQDTEETVIFPAHDAGMHQSSPGKPVRYARRIHLIFFPCQIRHFFLANSFSVKKARSSQKKSRFSESGRIIVVFCLVDEIAVKRLCIIL